MQLYHNIELETIELQKLKLPFVFIFYFQLQHNFKVVRLLTVIKLQHECR